MLSSMSWKEGHTNVKYLQCWDLRPRSLFRMEPLVKNWKELGIQWLLKMCTQSICQTWAIMGAPSDVTPRRMGSDQTRSKRIGERVHSQVWEIIQYQSSFKTRKVEVGHQSHDPKSLLAINRHQWKYLRHFKKTKVNIIRIWLDYLSSMFGNGVSILVKSWKKNGTDDCRTGPHVKCGREANSLDTTVKNNLWSKQDWTLIQSLQR